MKYFIGLIMLVCLSLSSVQAQDIHFYYYQGEKIALQLNTEYAYLQLDNLESPERLGRMLDGAEVTKFGAYRPAETLNEIPESQPEKKDQYWAEIHFLTQRTPDSYQKTLEKLKALPGVVNVAPYFSKGMDKQIGLSDLFVVKIKETNSPDVLMDFAQQHQVKVIGQNRFMPEWYTLQVTPASQGNALEMANLFFESGLFVAAEPDLMLDELHCVNDPYFGLQWGFKNTGQWGSGSNVDIRACDAWDNWTIGTPNVVIAVVDQGIDSLHPDLVGNIYGSGFDSESGTTPARLLGEHGTPCAGIIAARKDNNIGVVGVAPNCKVMSISNSLQSTPNSRQKRGDGINWAWQNGAAVISSSWRSGIQYSIIDNAITNAQNFGRGGLGTVIVFSVGNANSSVVSYPANLNDDILAVGAISPCGERKHPNSCDGETGWGSNWGPELDVMAPGVKVPTTDNFGSAGYGPKYYMEDFNGTSAAAPHVAGLAGLLIGMNPCLTQRQVGDIIERTAQKVGGYNYATSAGRENGTWHDQMGYGLIDVHAAVEMTRRLYVQNVAHSGPKTYQVQGEIIAGSQVNTDWVFGPVNVNSGSHVKLHATQSISLEAGFNVSLGAILDANIVANSCSTWDPNARLAPPALVSEAIATANGTENQLAEVEVSSKGLSILPNPFEDQLTLVYDLAKPGRVEASLFNLQGQKVAVLIPDGIHAVGHFKQRIALGKQLPDGIYFVRMQVEDRVYTRKLVHQ